MTDRVDSVESASSAGTMAEQWLRGQPSRRTLVTYDGLRLALAGLCRLWWRVEVVGREYIPATGPFIVSPVHRSYIDTPLMVNLTRRRLRYMGKESMWDNRAVGAVLSAVGGFPVQRGTTDRGALRQSQLVLESGHPLVMFPEGTRKSGPVVSDLFDGPAFLSCRTGAPIVPVGIGGSARSMAIDAQMIKPTKIVLVIGEPIQPPAKTERGRVPRSAVRNLSDELRVAIQELYENAQARLGLEP